MDVAKHLSHMINFLKQQGSAENVKQRVLHFKNSIRLYTGCHTGLLVACNVALFTPTVLPDKLKGKKLKER